MKKEKERGEKSDYDGDYDSDGDCGAVIGWVEDEDFQPLTIQWDTSFRF